MQIAKILVSLDFSDYSEGALQWALALAEQQNAQVLLFHVIPSLPDEWVGQLVAQEKTIEEELTAKAEQRLHAAAAGRPVQIRSLVVRGDPATEICEHAQRQGADLIVMGTHGRTGLARMLIGSVAERVVRHAPCSVLVVRASQDG